MEIYFVWENSPPDSAPSERIEESLRFVLNAFADPRKLEPEKLIVRLTTDKTLISVDGIGYDQNGVPIFMVVWSFSGPQPLYSCRYCDEPQQPES